MLVFTHREILLEGRKKATTSVRTTWLTHKLVPPVQKSSCHGKKTNHSNQTVNMCIKVNGNC